MKLVFYAHRGNALISRLIRIVSPRFNHISIRTGDFVYEAHIKGGVTCTYYKDWKGKKTVADRKVMTLTIEESARVVAFLEAQVGKKYDITGIFAFLTVFSKPRKGRWFCSELAMVALLKVLNRKLPFENQKVSPDMFWLILNLVV